MPTTVNAPDGTQINFPDTMDDTAIKAVMRKRFPPTTVMQPSPSEQMAATHSMSSDALSRAVAAKPMPNVQPNWEQLASQQEADAIQPKPKQKLSGGGLPNSVIPEELRPITDADVMKRALANRVPGKAYAAPPNAGELMYARSAIESEREGSVKLRNPGATAVSASGYQGWGQLYHGLKTLPQNPLGGLADIGEGGLDAASPLMIFAGATAPETAAKAVFGATLGGIAGTEGTKRFTSNEDIQRLGGLAGTVMGGGFATGPEIASQVRARIVDNVAKSFAAQGVDPATAVQYANHAVDMYHATGDASYIGGENVMGQPGPSKVLRLQGQTALEAAQQIGAAASGKHPESDVDYETRRAPAPELVEPIDSKIANAQMRVRNAPPLSTTKANLLEVLDQHLQDKAAAANSDVTGAGEVQPGSASVPMGRNIQDLFTASEAKVSPETPEQAAAARERYLNLTKGEPIGPSKIYDPKTGEPVLGETTEKSYKTFPKEFQSIVVQDTDAMGRARQELFPGKAHGDLTSAQQSEVIQRSIQIKQEAATQYAMDKQDMMQHYASSQAADAGLAPRGGFKGPPLGREGERGSLWLKPKKVPNSGSPLGQLTDKLQDGLGELPPGADRLSMAERLADSYGPTGDAIKDGLVRLTAHTAGLINKYLRPAKYTDFDRAIGEFSGDLQRNGLESRRFVERVMNEVPDKLRREGITNYIQANGDKTLLAQQASQTKDVRLRRGYEVAANLTPKEEGLAREIRTYFDDQLHQAQTTGMLSNGVENYVNQIWKRGEEKGGLLTSAYNNDLKPNPDLVRKRIFQDYFEGEQAGKIPRSKDIGFLITAYNKSFSQALASRAFISKLAAGKKVKIAESANAGDRYKWTGALAEDGRPIIAAPASSGKEVMTPEGEVVHLVMPRVAPDEELQGYRPISHPALSNWKWAGQSTEGEPIFVKGQLQVHPDYYDKLNNVFKTSFLKRSPTLNNIMKVSSQVKGTLLSFSAFHQVQEGIHAAFHKVNPFHPAEIDLNDVVTNHLLDHGLVIGGDTGIQQFAEGMHGTGLAAHIPGVGPMLNKYTNYLFGDYIPRLKVAMAKAAFERNMERYGNKYTRDQILRLSAEQSNAAFGELNYKMLGRDPSVQDALRFMTLAPDFLEARARFVGQALRPDGAEQRAALIRGAAGMYITARIVNKLLDENPDPTDLEGYHFDTPFGIVYNGREYNLRSVPGDIENLMRDRGSFVNHRLNPTIARPFQEFVTGKDEFGRKRDMWGQIIDFTKNVIPIPGQSLVQKYLEKGFDERTGWDSVREAVGISSKKYRSLAGRLAHQYIMDSLPPNHDSRGISYLANKIQNGKFDGKEASNLVASGRMKVEDVVKAIDMAQQPELLRNFEDRNIHLPQAVEIYALATDKERAMLAPAFAQKMRTIDQLSPEEQEQVRKRLARISYWKYRDIVPF